MPSPKRAGLPSFWVTDLAKILVGDQPCRLQAWLKGHLNLIKRPREDSASLAKWKTEHTTLLQWEISNLKVAGWTVRVEQFFRVTGQAAIVSGKTDIIAQQDGQRPVIEDCKSGAPSETHIAQLELYLTLIPMAWQSPSMIFNGEVVYPTHRVAVTPADALELKPKLFALVKQLATDVRPPASPSESACRFCEVGDDDCPDRFVARTDADVLTTEW